MEGALISLGKAFKLHEALKLGLQVSATCQFFYSPCSM